MLAMARNDSQSLAPLYRIRPKTAENPNLSDTTYTLHGRPHYINTFIIKRHKQKLTGFPICTAITAAFPSFARTASLNSSTLYPLVAESEKALN